MMSKNDAMLENMVEVARFSSSTEAAAARNLLADADIPACLDGEAMASWFWFYGSAIGGVKLLVNERDTDRASAILSTPFDPSDFDCVDFHDELADDDIDVSEELSPQLIHAFRASVMGILLFPPLLNIYSVFLIVRHKLLRPPLNWRITIACTANFFVFLLVSVFLYAAIAPPPEPVEFYYRDPDGTLREVKYETRTVSVPLVPHKPITVSTDHNGK